MVAGLVAAQFPRLAGLPVRALGAGWDHEVFTVGPDWILRFPQRADRVPWLVREVDIMTVVSEALGAMVPRFELIGHPSDTYPYPFVGYPRLPGVGAAGVGAGVEVGAGGADDLGDLAADIGALLSRLHRIDPDPLPPTPDGWEHEGWASLRTEVAGIANVVRPLLDARLLALAAPYLAGQVPEPAQDGPRRFVHNDICPDHLLVDGGRLTGLIDFTDAMVGDPVLDFVGLIGIGGYGFIRDVAASYDLPLGDSFTTKLRWLTRMLTLTWLADAAADDPPHHIPKHLSWVTRAFAN
jgi:aminoglycoside phosphotransferase (APT) family kinase protein